MKIALIDNYDSFTFNVYHYLKNIKCEVEVLRNDKFKIKQIRNFDKIVISPGPGNPSQAGKCLELIEYYFKNKPILGIARSPIKWTPNDKPTTNEIKINHLSDLSVSNSDSHFKPSQKSIDNINVAIA